MILHKLEGYIQAIYLAEHDNGLLLLDGCARPDVDTVCEFITTTLNRPLSDLKLIVVTHMHPDHAGAAHKLRSITGAKIAASNNPSQWYRGIDGFFMHLTDMYLARWVAARKGKKKRYLWYSRTLKADYFLADQHTLPEFEQWQVFHTPGHTDRDISLLHKPSKRLYIADLLVKVKNQLVAPYPVFYPKLYRASLARLNDIQPKTLILAHQNEIEFSAINLPAIIDDAPTKPMTHWRSVKSKFKKALSKTN